MERHVLALLDEEQHQSVVIITFYGNLVEIILEMIWIGSSGLAGDAQ